MKPTSMDLHIVCGLTLDAQALLLTLKQGGVPVPLLGYSAEAKAVAGNGQTIFSLTTANGGIQLGGAAGTIAFVRTAQQTSAMWLPSLNHLKRGLEAVPVGSWMLRLTSGSGRVTSPLAGRLLLTPEL